MSVSVESGSSTGATDQMLCSVVLSTTVRSVAVSGRWDSANGSQTGRNRTVTPTNALST